MSAAIEERWCLCPGNSKSFKQFWKAALFCFIFQVEEKLYSAALSLADEVIKNAPVSVQLAKQLTNAAGGLDTGLVLESIASALSGTTDDNKEGVASFRERRAAKYKGS